eukprot:1429200-Karenia_brevis.AAC.1
MAMTLPCNQFSSSARSALRKLTLHEERLTKRTLARRQGAQAVARVGLPTNGHVHAMSSGTSAKCTVPIPAPGVHGTKD